MRCIKLKIVKLHTINIIIVEVTMIKHEDVIDRYKSHGFVEYDIYPSAKTVIMTDGYNYVTIKNGKVRNGQHPPKN